MKFPDIKALGARLKPQPKKDEAIALAAELKPQAGKDEAIAPPKKKKISFSLRKIIGEKSVRHYDPDIHAPLVDAVIPPGYAEVDRYWVETGRSIIIIATNMQTNQYEYLLFEPTLSEFEYELLERIHEDLRSALILTDEEIKKDRRELLIEKMDMLLKEYGISLSDTAQFKLQYFLIRNFLGWGRLDPLMKDRWLEDISCDGNMIPIFLYHRKYRNIKTNIMFEEEVLNSLAITLAQRSGKHISTGSPMLDATLPDGSRLQVTLGTEVTTRGTSFTIRKFREEPFSPVELIDNGSFSADELVYFWMAIENNKSLLFIGGTASGKTTSLNAVSLFIPPMAKVVSIEDTREITLYHENWIASVTRESVAEGSNLIDMFDLLRSAMRQRPEYILVGEVRGHEAQTLFQAMNTGHTTFSTMHAGSVDAAIHRLESEPLKVPRNMVTALDVVSVQALVYVGTERVRRALEVVEIAGIDPVTGNLRVNTVFTWDPVKDTISYKGRSAVYSDIAERRGWSRETLEHEIEVRKKILLAMQTQRIIDYISVSRILHTYYIEPEKVFGAMDDLTRLLQ
jgi:flagellar protein FlaI